MTNSYITIDSNSDLDPVTLATDTDDEIAFARRYMRDAGLAWEYIHAGDPNDPDSYRTDRKLFADITDDEIRALATNAGAHGDVTMVEICGSALRGNADHRDHCAHVIATAHDFSADESDAT